MPRHLSVVSDDNTFPRGLGENQMAFIYLGNAEVQISAK